MKIRGVNLGNWLALEKWMQPELFEGTNEEDELGLFTDLPEESIRRLEKHYEDYVTEEDVEFLYKAGVNLLRIPVTYYIFGDIEGRPCGITYLDRMFEWTEKRGIKILIDLHSVEGGQNAFDNSGFCGLCTWHMHPEYVEQAFSVLERLAKRYQNRSNLFGITPLNEPANDILLNANRARYGAIYPERLAISEGVPEAFVKQFYLDVYQRIHPLLPEGAVLVYSDQFNLHQWNDFMPMEEYPDVWFDTHKYLCFSEGEIGGESVNYPGGSECVRPGLVLENYVKYIREQFRTDVESAARFHPVMVGEWCLDQNMDDLKETEDTAEIQRIYRTLADEQMAAWDAAEGGVFWSFRVEPEKQKSWDFCECVKRGWISYR